MRALVFLVQLLLWLLIIRIVVRGIAGLFARRPAAPRREPPRAQAARQIEDLVLDRVCGTHIPRSTAIGARIEGREELFCSEVCRDKALSTVARAS
jgi:hypothetical protein